MNRQQRRRMESVHPHTRPGMQIVIFRRENGWYPLELPLDADLGKHAECNPGTVRIETIDGTVLWQPS